MKKFESPEIDKMFANFLKSDQTIAASEFGAAGITVGFSGKLEGLGLTEVSGPGTSVRTALQGPQTIGGVVVAKVGENSQSAGLIFEGGARTIALGALQQHGETTFTFNNGIELAAQKMIGKDWAKCVGATLELVDTYLDAAKPIIRTSTVNGKPEQNSRPSRVYKFTVSADY